MPHRRRKAQNGSKVCAKRVQRTRGCGILGPECLKEDGHAGKTKKELWELAKRIKAEAVEERARRGET